MNRKLKIHSPNSYSIKYKNMFSKSGSQVLNNIKIIIIIINYHSKILLTS